MTDEAVNACSLAKDFYQAPKKKPIYQICAYGDLRINTDVIGNYAVYGNNYDSFQYKYYTGVAAAVTKSTLSVIVDMTKIAKTDLKSYWGGGNEVSITGEDTVDLTGYKPYIARLGKKENDPDNYIMTAWNWADLMKMTANATFPTSLNKFEPGVLSHYAGVMNGWQHESLSNNSFIFIADSENNTNEFCFTEGTWSLKACGATITALNEEVQLFINNGDNIRFANGVLTAGNKYIVTLIIKSDNKPYVKVSEVDSAITAISIKSTNHKTSYFVGSSLDVNNLAIKVTRNDGTKQIINVSSDMVSGFDSSKIGTQTLTVTYGSYTATYDIEIKELQTTATSSNVADIISELPYSSEPYTIKVTGSIISFTLETIRNAMNDNWIRINLDLSETTGLTSIGEWAFSGCSNLTSVTIPAGVTEIGDRAFSGCSSLTSVTIPDGVTTIGDGAFVDCRSLTSVTIPDGVTEIGCDTFRNCSDLVGNEYDNALYLGNESNPYLVLVKAKNRNITSCEINASTKTITDYAFSDCSSLSSVTIPDSVTSIGSSAFKDCSSLTTFNVDANNENYSSSDDGKILYNKDKTQIIAYPSATGNITIPDGVTEIKESEFAGSESLTSIVIPDSVTKIGSQAFYNCSSLVSVTMGNGVKEIGYGAFEYCKNLTSITIPDSVTSIGSYAFYNCSSLTSVTIGNGVKEIDNGAFNNCENLKFNEYKDGFYLGNEDNPYLALIKIKSKDITSFEINSATKIIASNVFEDCSSLSSITIPDSVTSIGSSAFWECKSLTSVTIPDGVTSIGIQAFYNCSSLTSVTIPDGVTIINASAFYNCSSLTSITIPDGVTKIDWSAFFGCSSLTSITIPDGVTEISHGAFNNCDNLETFDVDRNNKNYCTSDDGRILYNKDKTILLQCAGSVSGDIIIPDSVTSIEGSAFSGCSNLTSVTIPDSVTSIGSQAFSGCSNLTSVTIPDSVTSIGNDAFSGCSSLTSITIPDSVTSIYASAFNWCDNLESITIPDSITVIGEKAFIGCLSLKTVNYKGTKAQWDNIVIDDYNYYLTGATINYNYSGE